jgi:hypothetical protein
MTLANGPQSATDAQVERLFLRQLRRNGAFLQFRPYAYWMSKRSHINLL